MGRLTRTAGDNYYYVVDDDKVKHDSEGCSGDAINKLAKFENMYEAIEANLGEISEELEKLRNEGKTHSFKFKELMAQKITNNNCMILFKKYGL